MDMKKLLLLPVVVLLVIASSCATSYFILTRSAPASGEQTQLPTGVIQTQPSAEAAPQSRQSSIEARPQAEATPSAAHESDKQEEPKHQRPQKTYIICIDPGHQQKGNNESEPIGPGAEEQKPKVSSGTAGVFTKVPEYQVNLEVSLLLRDALEQKGYLVVMTRETNEIDISNKERAEIANQSKADIYLRLHADGSELSSTSGISVLCPSGESSYTKDIFDQSRLLASSLLEELTKATGAKSRGISYRADLSGFNWSKVPVALVEMGFLTNAEEDQKLNTKEYQLKMVDGLVAGIEKYFQRSMGHQ